MFLLGLYKLIYLTFINYLFILPQLEVAFLTDSPQCQLHLPGNYPQPLRCPRGVVCVLMIGGVSKDGKVLVRFLVWLRMEVVDLLYPGFVPTVLEGQQ